jgi:hypothetical protein
MRIRLLGNRLDFGKGQERQEADEEEEQDAKEAEGSKEGEDIDNRRAEVIPVRLGRKSLASEVTVMTKRSNHMPTLMKQDRIQTSQRFSRPSGTRRTAA